MTRGEGERVFFFNGPATPEIYTFPTRRSSGLDDRDGFYRNWGDAAFRSEMNAAFTLPTAELEDKFLHEAELAGFSGLTGHRAIGGIRASIYNALTLGAVEKLSNFMDDFRFKQHGK